MSERRLAAWPTQASSGSETSIATVSQRALSRASRRSAHAPFRKLAHHRLDRLAARAEDGRDDEHVVVRGDLLADQERVEDVGQDGLDVRDQDVPVRVVPVSGDSENCPRDEAGHDAEEEGKRAGPVDDRVEPAVEAAPGRGHAAGQLDCWRVGARRLGRQVLRRGELFLRLEPVAVRGAGRERIFLLIIESGRCEERRAHGEGGASARCGEDTDETAEHLGRRRMGFAAHASL